METAEIFLDFFFGIVGLAYLTYARKQQHTSAFIAGMALSVFPFFISNVWLTIVIGVLLSAFPFIVEI